MMSEWSDKKDDHMISYLFIVTSHVIADVTHLLSLTRYIKRTQKTWSIDMNP